MAVKKIIQSFKDFLKGNTSQELHEKCAPFLKQSEGKPLYRGYGMTPGFKSKEVEVRKDRQPRDTAPLIHKLMDDYFNDRFGMRVRSQGLFTIGDSFKSDAYGYPYYVFPVGEFKFLWGELDGKPIQDTLLLSNMIKEKTRVSPSAEAPTIVKEILDKVKWKTTGLADAIESKAEIIIMVDKVILVPVNKKVPYEDIIK